MVDRLYCIGKIMTTFDRADNGTPNGMADA